ncbi:glycosyltransferase family 2 protein [Haloarcula nitratireducens]|uniref:Glycosyltransferase n=1 Tax=Haloarcula nitratireducens TaxID=2487749 RepID=A0AAW4PFL5_9EURY|nr:glycosyltransferase [Halomicroarcula nitratireducens]MBX0296663.1 glycosyltransferase [Halomicroarcula nitratireducens]
MTRLNEEFEVVIPSIKENILTTDSIPENIPVHIIGEGTINEARNIGVSKSNAETIVILDDDLSFDKSTLYDIVDMVDENTLVGMAEDTVGLILGRSMVFKKSLWRDIGGFDERLMSHNGDTDFAIRSKKNNYEIKRFPQSWFYHEEHSRSVTTFDRAWRLAYLCIKHPNWAPHLIDSFLLKPHFPWIRMWSSRN